MTNLRLYLLGAPHIEAAQQPKAIPRRKGLALLVYLAVSGEELRRDTLATLLWPASNQSRARGALRRELSKLGALVGNARFKTTRETIRLRLDEDIWLDVAAFDAHLGGKEATIERLEQAIALYRDDFLAGFSLSDCPDFDEWQRFQAEALRRRYADALDDLAQLYAAADNCAAAIPYAVQRLALDPLYEPGQRALMRLYAQTGQRALALRQYEAYTRLLDEEIGAPPEAETVELAKAIRERRLASGDARAAGEQGNQTAPDSASTVSATRAHVDHDWGDALLQTPAGHGFYGREGELAQLTGWLVQDGCRLVTILGMGGVGKSALAVRLARGVAGDFDSVIWRSLLNAPPLEDTLRAWLHFLSHHQLAQLPATLDERLQLLLEYLRAQRCLLVLDNCETLLQAGEQAGRYRPGYADYGRLLHWFASQEHRSCLLLTSRERPHGLERLEKENPAVRGFDLAGLVPEAGRTLLQEQGVRVEASLGDDLVARYSGNPLALKLVADTLQDLFGGDVAAFLEQETPLFDDIREVLDQQFARLSQLEQDLILWLAVEREPLSLATLEADLVEPVRRGQLLTALRGLQRRSLVEQVDAGEQGIRFTLQNVVMEYAGELLIATIYDEILAGGSEWLNRYALLKAQAKEYVRQSQVRLLVAPLARRLVARLGRVGLETRLKDILARLRAHAPLEPGYAAGNILNLLLHLGYNLAGYDFSQLVVWQTYLRGIAVQDVDFSHADLRGGVFTETLGAVLSVALSPDGHYLAASTEWEDIRLWQATPDWSSPQPYRTLAVPASQVFTVGFSPDSRMLATGSAVWEMVSLWDVQTGERRAVLQGHTAAVRSVCFSPNGRTLASASHDQTIRLWDVPSGECRIVLQGHTDWIFAVCYSPDGRTLASASYDHTVRLWDVQSGECRAILQGHTEWVLAVAFHPDGHTLASASRDHTVRLWDVPTGECRAILQEHMGWVFSVHFSPDGHTLASGSEDLTARLWDAQTGACLRILQGPTKWIASLSFSPDGRTLAGGSGDHSVWLWDTATGQSLRSLQGHSTWIRALAFSADGRTLAGSDDTRSIHLWDAATAQRRHTLHGHAARVWSLAFSPDGRMLASGSVDETVRLWDTARGELLHTLHEHTQLVMGVCFSPDGRMLASGSEDRTVRLWDVATGECIRVLHGHTAWVNSVAFSPDGCTLASGSGDQTVRLWDMATGDALGIPLKHKDSVATIRFSPDGRTLASGGDDLNVWLWNVATGECLHSLSGHTQTIRTFCFSPDGHTLVSACRLQMVRLWDVATGECLHVLPGQSRTIYSLCFSPDGRILAGGGADQTVQFRDVTTGECLRTLRSDRPYERMNITAATGLAAGQITTLKALGAVQNQ